MIFTRFRATPRRADKVDWIKNLPLLTVALSMFSGALCFTLKGRAARAYTLAYEALLVAACALVLAYTLRTGRAFTYKLGEFPAPWGNELRAGALESLMATAFSAIMLCAVSAGKRFADIDMDPSKLNLYYAVLNLMTAALMALLWTNDLFTGYVFLEILTLTSCGALIVREIGRTTLAAVRYMVLNLLGSGLFLLSVALLYDLTGNLLMVPMHAQIAQLAAEPGNMRILTLVLGIMTTGLAIKSGLFPFHFWMPDTYGYATPTSAAALSSLVSKAYIFLLFKIYWRVFGADVFAAMRIDDILTVLGMCGMVFGSIEAMHANNINRMVAFSSAAQIGYIYLGLGMGGELGFVAALFHILAHALTKSLLFLTTPRLAEVSGGRLLFKNLQGSGLRDKGAGVFFGIGALSMTGIPVFAGFSSKLLFATAAVDTSDLRLILVILALAASSTLNAIYFIRTLVRIYSAPPEAVDYAPAPRGLRLYYTLPMLALTAGNLLLGLFSGLIVDCISRGLSMF